MDLSEILKWVPWLVTAIFFADKAIAALKRLVAAPTELRGTILRRAEEIHAEQLREQAELLLSSRADEIIALFSRVGTLETLQRETLALLRPNGGSSLADQLGKLDRDFRDSITDSQRFRRDVMARLDEAPRDEHGA